MKEVVLEHLREERLHAPLGELAHVRAAFAQTLHVGNRHAPYPLEHQYVLGTVVQYTLGA